jgi:arsenate reductase
MAEDFLNALCREKCEAKSAGITHTGLNPHVVKAKSEVGIDLSTHKSKSLIEFQGKTFNYLVTVCNSGRENCPFFLGEIEIGKSFPDPSAFTETEEEIMRNVRVVRDGIKNWVTSTFCEGNLPKGDLAELYRG